MKGVRAVCEDRQPGAGDQRGEGALPAAVIEAFGAVSKRGGQHESRGATARRSASRSQARPAARWPNPR